VTRRLGLRTTTDTPAVAGVLVAPRGPV
jgi:hypothetical protein